MVQQIDLIFFEEDTPATTLESYLIENYDLGVRTYVVSQKAFSDQEIGLILPNLGEVNTPVVYCSSLPGKPVESVFRCLMLTHSVFWKTARKPVLIMPYMPFMRQDRVARDEEPFTFKLMSSFFSSSFIKALITFNLHKEQLEGFFNVPVIHIKLWEWILHVLQNSIIPGKESNNLLLAADQGVYKIGLWVLNNLGGDVGQWTLEFVVKSRLHGVQLFSKLDISRFDTVYIFDDILSSGKTILQSVRSLAALAKDSKKDTDQIDFKIMCGHGLFTDKEVYKDLVNVTNGIYTSDSLLLDTQGLKEVTQVSLAPLVAQRLIQLLD